MKLKLCHARILVVVTGLISGFVSSAQQADQASKIHQSPSADELAARKLMDRLDADPDCHPYVRTSMEKIGKKAMEYDPKTITHDTHVYVRFRIHQDGTVSDVSLSGATNSLVAPLCKRRIEGCSPFPKWPKKMASIIGKDYWEIFYDFGFNMTLH
jgi:hypothetical protein